MDKEIEMIRQQMDDSRTALTDKLEVLEQQVVDTVQGATSSVSDTVENVKDIVHDTMQTVKESMQETVDTVKDAFDLKRQVDRRPWTMLAGATALGFFGGYLLRGSRALPKRESGRSDLAALAASLNAAVARNGLPVSHQPGSNGTPITADANAATDKPSLMTNLGDTFQAEIAQLKGLAVGTLLGIVRDLITKSVPQPMEQQMEEMINGITVKLGGKPIQGCLLPEESESARLSKIEKLEDRECRDQSSHQNMHSRVLAAIPPAEHAALGPFIGSFE